MSSTVSTTEVQTISKIAQTPRKMEEKRLVRTSSLEKIRRFNSFICSQQYYVLPALLAWLRSSQTVLQSNTEKTIFFFRSLIFSHLLYKFCQDEFKAIVANVRNLHEKEWLKRRYLFKLSSEKTITFYKNFRREIHPQLERVSTNCRKIVESPSTLKMAVYSVLAVLTVKLGLCFYLFCNACMPGGLMFLICSILYIMHLHIRTVYFSDRKNVMKKIN